MQEFRHHHLEQKTIEEVDTTLNPAKGITYFTANDWIYADEDEWVYDPTNVKVNNDDDDNRCLGYRPAWKTTNGTYSYDQQIRQKERHQLS